MSVVFTTYSDQFIMICADKQATNMRTGEISTTTKIERWAPFMAVAWAGNGTLGKMIVDAVHGFAAQEKRIADYTVEEMSDMFCQCFYAAKDQYPDMPAGVVVKFIIAGKLKNGKLGVGDIYANDEGPDLEIYEGKPMPSTIIFAAEDMTDDECNQLFQKAIVSCKNQKTPQRNLLEMVHRKAVRYVSELSKFVGYKSDFIEITLNSK